MIQSHTKVTAAITTSGSTATPPNLYQRSTPCTFPEPAPGWQQARRWSDRFHKRSQ